ncbi:hypothetical protein [Candidatus Odyssella thessalonicensis]|uniref:hypothetical protein n=1 Tax=Candidatus Odyssella thessalonicensis TaxID=84647 RepID=UPI000225B958|nr:hypothetical protein [Candidatus Odyssella thessalonicensis]
MKAVYLSFLIASLCACTPQNYNVNTSKRLLTQSSKFNRSEILNPAYLQGAVWKTLEMAKSGELTAEDSELVLTLIKTLNNKGLQKKSITDKIDSLLKQIRDRKLSQADFIKGLQSILHHLEVETGFIINPQFEQFSKRYFSSEKRN